MHGHLDTIHSLLGRDVKTAETWRLVSELVKLSVVFGLTLTGLGLESVEAVSYM